MSDKRCDLTTRNEVLRHSGLSCVLERLKELRPLILRINPLIAEFNAEIHLPWQVAGVS